MSKSDKDPISDEDPSKSPAKDWGQAIADNLNRNVMREFEEDVAALPPWVRARYTRQGLLDMPPLQLLKLRNEPETD